MPQSNRDQALIQQLIQQHGGSDNADLVEDIIETALRLVDDKTDRLDTKVITSALKELRYASKIFSPFRGKRKVTVFGSARTKPDAPEYQQAVALWQDDCRARLHGHHGVAAKGLWARRNAAQAATTASA